MSEVAPLVDVAGNTIDIGDWVVYPQMSGRSVQNVLGKLVEWNGKTAKIERVEGGRWAPGWQSTKYRDKRTGKNIDIWSGNYKHFEIPPHTTYVHRETSEELTEEQYNTRFPRASYDRSRIIERGKFDQKYHRGKLHDYVEEFKLPLKPVTIYNVKNIVKVVPAEGREE